MKILYFLLLLFTINIIPVHAGLVPASNVVVNVDVPPAKKKKRKKRRKRIHRKKKIKTTRAGKILKIIGVICLGVVLIIGIVLLSLFLAGNPINMFWVPPIALAATALIVGTYLLAIGTRLNNRNKDWDIDYR